jgi:N-methylhydantoinase A
MEQTGRDMLAQAGIPAEHQILQRSADLRYPRQAYELTVPVEDGPFTADTITRLMDAFHRKHQQTYGHANPGNPVQMVNLRLTATGRLPPVKLRQTPSETPRAVSPRDAWFPATGTTACTVYWRDALTSGTTLTGPAIIDALDCTAIIPPAWTGQVDEDGFIHLRKTNA